MFMLEKENARQVESTTFEIVTIINLRVVESILASSNTLDSLFRWRSNCRSHAIYNPLTMSSSTINYATIVALNP